MRMLFTKENMYTGTGFVRDSFAADQAEFVAVAGNEFDQQFLQDFEAARATIQGATGGALRSGGLTQVTTRLYANLDRVKPLLDRLDIRLGLVATAELTVPAKKFGLKGLRERLAARDAEAASRALTVLEQAIADNLTVLQQRGYAAKEQQELEDLHKLIDDDNRLQNETLNANTGATKVEDADYRAVDKLLGKIMRTGRLLYKADKQKRRQYEATAILKRMQAGEHPKGAGPA